MTGQLWHCGPVGGAVRRIAATDPEMAMSYKVEAVNLLQKIGSSPAEASPGQTVYLITLYALPEILLDTLHLVCVFVILLPPFSVVNCLNMKFTASILTTLLVLTTSVVSIPTSKERFERRQLLRLLGSQPLKLDISDSEGEQHNPDTTPDNATHVTYSSNWAGAVIDAPPAGTTFSAAVGTFTVPTPSGKSGSAAAWVGIDGDTYQGAILQAGVDFTISNGEVSYDAWYEWFPDESYAFNNIRISAGDVITVSVKSTSSTSGTVTIENQSTGRTVHKSLTAPSSSAHLDGVNAEWIVEDYEENGSLVALADFGTVVFTDASATAGGETVGLDDATAFDIRQNGVVYAETTILSDSSVEIKYV